MEQFILGAYASAPSQEGWNEKLEAEYFDALRSEEFIDGLELQLKDSLHPQPQWLFRNLKPAWSYVVTTIGGTMVKGMKDPQFGLATEDEAGRARALAFMNKARDTVREINDKIGRKAVRAVEIHSAPKATNGVRTSVAAFRRSLDELRDLDWEGARLAIEHCDALVPGQSPEKGFVRLEQELQAIRESKGRTPVGASLNWGRSAIEARDPEAPAKHVRQMREAGVLEGIIFSGVTAAGDPQFPDWADRHAPFSDAHNATQRLLTPSRLKACLDETRSHPLTFLGLKIATAPPGLPPIERVREIRRCAQMLREAARQSER
jgi:hypothetical protein